MSVEQEIASEAETCWSFGNIHEASPGFGPGLCCRPAPCGQPSCWRPPEFTFGFCCGEGACRPTVVAQVQEALNLAVAGLPHRNASLTAFQAAPEAFRALLRRGLRGLRLGMANGLQACSCAIAYAAAVLLEPGGLTSALAGRVLAPRWFTEGVDWAQLVADGWGGLFALFALAEDHAVRAAPPPALLQATADDRAPLSSFLRQAQEQARLVVAGVEKEGAGFPALVAALRASGAWSRIWRRLEVDHAARQAGRKCAAVPAADGAAEWTLCSRWDYDQQANFSSPKPPPGPAGHGWSDVAACVLGAPRNVVDTYRQLRQRVVRPLGADVFVYVPFAGQMTGALEAQLRQIGPAVTAIAARDVDSLGMEARVVREVRDPRVLALYKRALGPWRAPVFGQMGSSMWGYHAQHACRHMVEAYEAQRGGRPYVWVVFARADLLWVHAHPPLREMDPRYIHVPYGQDNNYYAYGPLAGLNDRHAVVPRPLLKSYFGRWEELGSGAAWRYLQVAANGSHPINTEQYLLLHLRAHGAPVLRFPPVGFLVHCAEGPQCQHLYRATDLRRQSWASTAKYWTEVIEARRTIVDDLHWRVRRHEAGWIWSRLRPPTAPWPVSWMKAHPHSAPEAAHTASRPWELQGLDLVCCLSQSGPLSCHHWAFLRRCVCLAR